MAPVLPVPAQPLTPIERRQFDYSELEAAMAFAGETTRQAQQNLEALCSKPLSAVHAVHKETCAVQSLQALAPRSTRHRQCRCERNGPRIGHQYTITDRRIDLPAGYSDWLADLKARIRETRLRASLAVNAELIGLYWRIGRDILDRIDGAGSSQYRIDSEDLRLSCRWRRRSRWRESRGCTSRRPRWPSVAGW